MLVRFLGNLDCYCVKRAIRLLSFQMRDFEKQQAVQLLRLTVLTACISQQRNNASDAFQAGLLDPLKQFEFIAPVQFSAPLPSCAWIAAAHDMPLRSGIS
jgi:hypothetical protein